MSEQVLKEMLVFYNKNQCVNEDVGYSPSARKPKLVVEGWRQLGYPITIKKIRALSVDEIAVAHDKDYVKGILTGKLKNGFDNKSLNVAKSLPWTTGSFFCAAAHAYAHQVNTFSPTSGFHHAGYNHAKGFCTFNGLAIAAILLKTQYKAKRIGILDLDAHAGDGTEDIIHKTKSGDFISHYSLGNYDIAKHNNIEWLRDLPALIKENFADCDILLYQAGVDCHEHDPLAQTGHFTTEQIYIRDKLVYATCSALRIPVVTNLAGGYQNSIQKVIDLHNLTAKAFQDI